MAISDSAKGNSLGVRISSDSSGDTYMFMHARFALASSAMHMRTTEHVDTGKPRLLWQYPIVPKGIHSE